MEVVESPALRADTASAQAQTEPYIPPPRAAGSRARTFVALAVILLLLVPATVAGVYRQQGASNRIQAESLLDLAEARLSSGQDALDRDDVTTGRTLLTEALNYAAQAEEILGRTARGSDLVVRIKRELQDVLHITLLYGIGQPLVTFPSDAEPQRVLVIDQDVYVLDTGRGQIIRYRMETTGQSLAESEGQVVLREGDIVDGVPVGPLVDIGWQAPIPGYEDKSNLLMLDNNNHVFRFNQQVDGVSLMDFGEDNGWQSGTQVETYSDRLYLADEGAGQVYRYAPGQYADPPVPWFDPATQVNLNGVEAMRIDGDIWLLFDDGKVLRYHSGEQVPFGLDDSVALPGDPVDMYVSQEGADTLYLADAQEERILLFSKQDGSYEGQFQAAEGNPLSGLRSIFIDEIRDTLFILTDSGLYQQDVPL